MLSEKSKLKVRLAEQRVQAARSQKEDESKRFPSGFRRNGNYSVCPRPAPIPITPEQLRRLAQVARLPPTNPSPTGVFEPLSEVFFQPGPFNPAFIPRLLSV